MIPFKTKFIECKKNGNLIEVDISAYNLGFPEIALVCLKHKKVCISKVCRKERGLEDNDSIQREAKRM